LINDNAWASLEPVYGVANFDDDDENGEKDWSVELVSEENDLSLLPISDLVAGVDEDEVLKVTLSGDDVRVWRDGELFLEDGDTKQLKGKDDLQIEFRDFLAEGTLTFIQRDADQNELARAEVGLLSGPLIINNHSQLAELVMAMSYTGNGGNSGFINGFKGVLGTDHFLDVPVSQYGYDVWVQDEIEFATLTAPGHRVDVVIDSIRTNNGSGLDDFPEDQFEGPDFARNTWGDAQANSQDSFGNMEASPPVTVDGVDYPFGKIYWGEYRGGGPRDSELLDFLEAQRVQAPFIHDVTWLCVGHVDEFSTFLPDPNADKGFKLLVTDVNAGYEFLEGLDPQFELPQYENDKGYATIGDVVNDKALRALNEDIQVDYLDPAIELFKTELGLTEDDIIRVPMLFEENAWCGGDTATFFPGTVNMTVAQLEEDGEVHVFLPDPFLRENNSTSSTARADDLFIAKFESLLPQNVTPHWLDDWDWYHMQLGEVHCGSNTIRTPNANWWEDALHLIGDDQ
jgi:protein-arginine deiminase